MEAVRADTGLYGKYMVTRPGNDTPLGDVFVLRPTKDVAARAALAAYAAATGDVHLRADLYDWLADIARAEATGGAADFPIPEGAVAAALAVQETQGAQPMQVPGGARVSTCRGAPGIPCTQQVFFARMVKADGSDGSKQPVCWPPHPDGGHLALVYAADGSLSMDGTNPRMRVLGRAAAEQLRAAGTQLYKGHFADCPAADYWRNGRGGGAGA